MAKNLTIWSPCVETNWQSPGNARRQWCSPLDPTKPTHKSCQLLQGCQMVCFQTKPVQFWYILEALWTGNFDIFYNHLVYILCGHLLYFMAIWYMFWQFISWQFGKCFDNSLKCPTFGILCQEKSGNTQLLSSK
jgi:hypothetical protein